MREPKAEKQFFFSNSTGNHGPFSSQTIRELARNGAIKPDDEIWKAGAEKRYLASSVPGLVFKSPQLEALGDRENKPQEEFSQAAPVTNVAIGTPCADTNLQRTEPNAAHSAADDLESVKEPEANSVDDEFNANVISTRKKLRGPFRSKLIGWPLKLAGVGWIILVLMTDLTEYIPSANSNVYLNFALFLPGFYLIRLGYRLCLNTFAPGNHADPRPPILFLRSFSSDIQGSIQPNTLLAKFHGIEPDLISFKKNPFLGFWFVHPTKLLRMLLNMDVHATEELLARTFKQLGPFVAIGRPGERLATPGADRMYVADSEWKQLVLAYLKASQIVVVRPSMTDGVRWELEQVFQKVPPHRILLDMSEFKSQKEKFEEFSHWFESHLRSPLSECGDCVEESCFIYFETTGQARCQRVCFSSPLLWSFTGNAVDTRRTFRSFIQGISGAGRSLPLLPQRRFIQALASVFVPIGALLLFMFSSMVFAYGRFYGLVYLDATRQYLTWSDQADLNRVTHKGKSEIVGYQFSLGQDWTLAPLNLEGAEYQFKYREKVGSLSIGISNYESMFEFTSDEFLAEAIRKDLQERLTKKFDTPCTLTLRSTKGVDVGNFHWLRLDLVRSFQGISERQWIWLNRSLGTQLLVSVTLPNLDVYERIAEDAFRAFVITATPGTILKNEMQVGKKIEYRGRSLDYTLSLSPKWKSEDYSKKDLEEMTATLGEVGNGPEYHFELIHGSKIAQIDIEVQEMDWELLSTEAAAQRQFDFTSDLMKSIAPGVAIENLGYREWSEHEHKWIELKTRTNFQKGELKGGFTSLTRFTSANGYCLSVGASIYSDDHAAMDLVVEAMDSLELKAERLLSESRTSWAGMQVYPVRANILLEPENQNVSDEPTVEVEYINYEVLKDQGDRLLVAQKGKNYRLRAQASVPANEAVEFFSKRIERSPGDTYAIHCRAIEYANRGDRERSIKDYGRLIAIEPQQYVWYYKRGVLFLNLNKHAEALKDFDSAASLCKTDFNVYMNRGVANDWLKRYEEARNDFSRVIELDPTSELGFCNRGLMHERLGQQLKGLNDYSEAIRLNPAYVKPLELRAAIFESQGASDRLMRDLESILRISPKNLFALRKMCNIHLSESAGRKRNPRQALIYAKELEGYGSQLSESDCQILAEVYDANGMEEIAEKWSSRANSLEDLKMEKAR